MTTASELEQVLAVCEAQYARTQQEFAKLRAKEEQLRDELRRLDQLGQASLTPSNEVSQMRAIGADIMWQSWLGRAKSTLNMSLAQVLAAKENHIDDVRKAYGKLQVVQELLSDLRIQKKKKAAQSALAVAIEMTVVPSKSD